MRVLVTGATGFLGFHLCRRLIESGHEVTALHRPTSKTEGLRASGVHLAAGDLNDPAELQRVFSRQELVFHSAADASWSADPGRQDRTNVEGTGNVARACRNVSIRMLHVSSIAAIGVPESGSRPADEQFTFNLRGSRSQYPISKKRAEEAVLAEVRRGLDAVIVNPAAIFGAWGDVYRGAGMIQNVTRGKYARYFAGGGCPVHVLDVAEGIVAAAREGRRGERYILGGENISYREIAIRSAKALQVNPRLLPIPAGFLTAIMALCGAAGRIRGTRPPLAVHYLGNRFQYYSSEKARTELGYCARGFNEILQDFVLWRTSQRSRRPETVAI